jgi:hypothetical protein
MLKIMLTASKGTLHQRDEFGDEFSSPILPNQISKFLVLAGMFCLPEQMIHAFNVRELSPEKI